MITSLEPGRRKVYRLALAPSIVNPRVNRLWLIPDGYRSPMPSEFDSILAGFRRVFVDLGSNRLAVYATYWDRFDGPLGDVCGEIHPIIDGKMKALTLFVKCDHYDIGKQFTVAAANAGAALSSKMRESVQALAPDSAFAWWMAVVWKFSALHPSEHRIQVGPVNKFAPTDCLERIGFYWRKPILASLSAIEEAGLVGPPPQAFAPSSAAAGKWSRYMTRTEFARCVTQNPKAKARDAENTFKELEKVRKAGKGEIAKWSFRLDKLDDSLRNKLEGSEPR